MKAAPESGTMLREWLDYLDEEERRLVANMRETSERLYRELNERARSTSARTDE